MGADVEDPNDAWEKGYDQAAREVLEEVKREDTRLYHKLLTKFPGWRQVMKERAEAVSQRETKSHCRDSWRGCCWQRGDCACECAKCVNTRAAKLM